ncbi:nitrogen fixation protein FixH [Limnohabitans sp. Hippo3]|uniref:nitrogen fixation protein FixH n=1 Tax=Limnohabitans sp. Hippo3 TaxID=1597956 RepID=UPI000D33FF0E|nr:nitrogen fixation protein FixH [Limnohabitans sp. Hippo3]PUE43485.1 nitrogen fixation protein FixH [Limnohabitans sp. Hippo3]
MNNALRKPQEGQPWWRFGLVWMVVGGPAVVVVAGLVTFYIAASNPDPVLQVTPRSAMQERQGIAHAPAMQGRNHAATGELPSAVQAPAAAPTQP